MAGTNKLSDKKLRSLLGVKRDSVITIADGEGLSIKVSMMGCISWVFSYRLGGRGSKLERIVLGRYPDMSLKMAREKRELCRKWYADGLNPRLELELSAEENLNPVTVHDALEYWLIHYARKNVVTRNSCGRNYVSIFIRVLATIRYPGVKRVTG